MMFDNIGQQLLMWWQSGWISALAALLTVVTLVGGIFIFNFLLRFIMRRVSSVR